MKKIEFFFLCLILVGAFVVRLYKFNGPVADWHSWRQADTSAVSRNFIKFGFDVLHPKFDDLSKGVSLLDNPQGYRFVEFPFYNILQAGLFRLFGHFTIEEWGRLVTNWSSLGGIVFIYLLVKRRVSTLAAISAACFYAFVPYNIYYGRVLLPDQSMVSALLGSTYFFDLWITGLERQKKIRWIVFFLSVFFFAVAVLLKPFVIFFGLPLMFLVYKKYSFALFRKKELWLFLVFSLLPFVLWRYWMQHYPQGIPRSDWLFNGTDIRFKGAYFWWLFADRIARLILSYWGLPLVLIGIMGRVKEKEDFFFHTFVVSSFVYFVVIATGNIQHDYYQILVVPTIAVFFGKGVDVIWSLARKNELQEKLSVVVVATCITFMLFFGWRDIREYYNINHPEIIAAGQAIDKLTPKDARIIAIYGGDTTFLYQTNRQGWPVFERPLTEFYSAGARYIAFVNPGKAELNFGNHYVTLTKTSDYAVFDLSKPLSLADDLTQIKNASGSAK